MKKEILTIQNLAIGINDPLIEAISIGIFQGEKIGIIGPNGSGKTTLLRTLAGELDSLKGLFRVQGKIFFVPQLKTNNNELLSGGEQSKKLLREALKSQSEVVLLDEPTNHLDLGSKKELVKNIQQFKGVVICVSHDLWFLQQITNRLLIIEQGIIRSFTGSYREYQQELERNKQAHLRKKEVIFKAQRKLEHVRDKQQKVASRSEKNARKAKFDHSESRMAISNKKNAIEKISARNKKVFDEKKQDLETSLQTLQEKKRKKVSGSIVAPERKGTIIRISHANLLVRDTCIARDIDMTLVSGERMGLLGNNGSGKSSLVKAMLGQNYFRLDPVASIHPHMRIEYLDQHYGLINPEKSVTENVLGFSDADRERAHQHLSHFLFDDPLLLTKKAKWLSGGMLARLAFVMLTISPIDLLILDEPTNNLDQETVQEIIEILNDYQGAMLVISHDVDFLEKIHITKTGVMGKTFKMYQISSEASVGDLITKVL